jgi:farnesyl diphosphate synthase
MQYGLVNGGKRIRPFLIIEISKILKVKKHDYMKLALATEMVHAYSLIHDDLPGMDNDDLRRGKPTTHKKYGEATAILAGNSLLTLSFEILSNKNMHPSALVRSNIIQELAIISGYKGLAGGQSYDLLYEKYKHIKEKEIIMMHKLKTAKLFEFCMVAPLLFTNSKSVKKMNDLRTYGKNFGLIFQATDDLLDFIGEKKILGKSVHKDIKRNKGNIMKFKSIDSVKKYCNDLAVSATTNSFMFKDKKNIFNSLIFYIINRVS